MSAFSAFVPLILIAVAVIAIFLVLGIFYVVQRQAEKAVRSPEYWSERPDGRRYPTGWDEEGSSSPGVDDRPDGDGSDR